MLYRRVMLFRWQKFRSLPISARKLFLQALCLLPMTGLAIRLFSFERIQLALQRSVRVGKNRGLDSAAASLLVQETARMVRAAADHGPFYGNCLRQSLALWWLLRRQGVESELHIGVRKAGARFEAHAWIEWLGRAVNERDDVRQRFAAFEEPILRAQAGVK